MFVDNVLPDKLHYEDYVVVKAVPGEASIPFPDFDTLARASHAIDVEDRGGAWYAWCEDVAADAFEDKVRVRGEFFTVQRLGLGTRRRDVSNVARDRRQGFTMEGSPSDDPVQQVVTETRKVRQGARQAEAKFAGFDDGIAGADPFGLLGVGSQIHAGGTVVDDPLDASSE